MLCACAAGRTTAVLIVRGGVCGDADVRVAVVRWTCADGDRHSQWVSAALCMR